ncbi:MAG: TonB-dependent receptor [Pseudomonadota bacterium]|nr:TonB-dependent receptor [Pseudomonadota bacterium]
MTAQKREQRAFDVPISIAAIGSDELQERNVTTLEDLSFAVPGLTVQSNGGYQRRIMLRGIGNVFGGASLIGMYVDEASVTTGPSGAGPYSQLDLRTYDLDRVEVLRGPQGTLYGEGSVGGTVRFITKNPDLDRFGMRADAAALLTEDGEPSQRIDAALNVPLVEDKLGIRVAGTYDRQGGWIDQPAAGRKDFNDQDMGDLRIKGLWIPVAGFHVGAMAIVHRNDTSFTGGEDEQGNFNQTFFDPTLVPKVTDDYDLYNLTLSYDLAQIRLLSTSSYVEQDKVMEGIALKLQLTPPPDPRFEFNNKLLELNSRIFTQELRVTSIGDSKAHWTIGGFYRKAESANYGENLFGLPNVFAAPSTVRGSNSSKAVAAFGDLSYDLSDKLTLGAGLRYFEDDQEAFTTLPVVTVQEGKFHSVNPRAYAQYKPTDNANFYASAAKGFRSGGFNAQNQPKYGPESVWTYELGTKLILAGGSLSAELSAYYSDYQDYQILGVVVGSTDFIQITSNAGDATLQGVEAALTWRPSDHWSVSFNGNYVDSEFEEINATMSSHAVGDQLDLFPKYSYAASVQRDFDLGSRSAYARLDYNEHGRATFRNRSVGPFYYSESDVIEMLNVSLHLQWSERVSLGLVGQNLLNDRGFTDPFDQTDKFASRARPRTYGIEFGMTFE